MGELRKGDKVVFKRDEFSYGPIYLYKVTRVYERDVDVRVQDEQGSYRSLKTSLIKVGSYE